MLEASARDFPRWDEPQSLLAKAYFATNRIDDADREVRRATSLAGRAAKLALVAALERSERARLTEGDHARRTRLRARLEMLDPL